MRSLVSAEREIQMSASSIQNQINSQRSSLHSLRSSLIAHEAALEELKQARTALLNIQRRYQYEIRSETSHPNSLLSISSKNSFGAKKIKSDVKESFSGPKEKNFVASIETSFEVLLAKIAQEEEQIASLTASINATKSALDSLDRALQTALAKEK